MARAIGQVNVIASTMLRMPLLLPPLPAQRRIAARLREQLAEVEKARAAVQAQLNAAEGLHAAQLRAAFGNSAVRHWPVTTSVDVSEISGGVTLGRDFRGRPTRRVPYLRVANVKDGWLDLSEIKEVQATEREISDCRLEFGDVLLTEGGDPDKLGRGTYWQEKIPECIHQNHISEFVLTSAPLTQVSWLSSLVHLTAKPIFLRTQNRPPGLPVSTAPSSASSRSLSLHWKNSANLPVSYRRKKNWSQLFLPGFETASRTLTTSPPPSCEKPLVVSSSTR